MCDESTSILESIYYFNFCAWKVKKDEVIEIEEDPAEESQQGPVDRYIQFLLKIITLNPKSLQIFQVLQ